MVVEPKDSELAELARIMRDLRRHNHDIFINVNNHYEGSTPRKIEKRKAKLSG